MSFGRRHFRLKSVERKQAELLAQLLITHGSAATEMLLLINEIVERDVSRRMAEHSVNPCAEIMIQPTKD